MFEGQVAKLAGRQIFPEDDLFKIVHNHAKLGAIAIAIPFLPAIDEILYVVILWHMYSKLSERAGKDICQAKDILRY